MPPDREAPAPASPLWSCRKIFAWILGLLVVFLTVLLAYDTELEPYDDLTPTPIRVPDARTNGYLMLKANSDKWPVMVGDGYRNWHKVLDGRVPWDDGVAEALNPSHYDFHRDLRQGLAAPQWVTPFPDPAVTINAGIWEFGHMPDVLEAAALQQLKSGKPDGTYSIIRDFRAWSLRQIKGSNGQRNFSFGCHLDHKAALLSCYQLFASPVSEASLQQLAECWGQDQLAQEDLRAPVSGESARLTAYFERGGYEDDFFLNHRTGAWLRRALTKKNATLNFMHRVMRIFQTDGMTTSPTKEANPLSSLDRLLGQEPGILRYLDTNYSGKQLAGQLLDYVLGTRSAFTVQPRMLLFQSRALQIAIAIKRWQLEHPGQIPVSLDELVPAFLTVIPPDPWDGRPLRWASVDQVIYSVGEDWYDEAPTFVHFKEWFSLNPEGPGLRLILPSRPGLRLVIPPPQPLPPATSK